MKFSPLSKTLVPLLRQSLNAYSIRHTATAENIANVGTKGYKPLKVAFEEELTKSLQKNRPKGLKTDSRHMNIGRSSVTPQMTKQNERVNLELEMASLAVNQIRFDFVARKLAGSYNMIRMAIRGHLG